MNSPLALLAALAGAGAAYAALMSKKTVVERTVMKPQAPASVVPYTTSTKWSDALSPAPAPVPYTQTNWADVMNKPIVPTLSPAPTSFVATAPAKVSTTYTVQKGDSLSLIAKRIWGDAGLWNALWDANPQISDPNRIEPGDVLTIPADPSSPMAGYHRAEGWGRARL